ncbi:MAG: 3-deoxy-7-phosphoheptulonate synthase AroG [Methylococcaceae bacterium]|nr:3-deoxy-7-phosphoheptulonate synthase AroG [Methylococcaceae bacterium]MCI0732437.1 3-deoxy-7-phosphoheptulonate synthase AroG [Methylococcaceae bacterium]
MNDIAVFKNTVATDDLRISEIREVAPPEIIHTELPITEAAARTTRDTRLSIHRILCAQDDRLLVIVGPCSIHDTQAAREYADRLLAIRPGLENELLLVMRVYFEKPRTTVGWKGLINDPELDESFNINKGLRLARKLLLDLNERGLPAATEYLDLITPQYVTDLISWGAIGARTTESQVHRELASGLSCPVGFKNATDGTVKVAVDAIGSACRPHHFLSMTKAGHSAIFSTTGNDDCHLILRGGQTPNYDRSSVENAAEALRNAGLRDSLMVDFSHANSNKQHQMQMVVGRDIAVQVAQGSTRILGVMIESHLVAGNQKVVPGRPLTYGQSITDACIGWEDTVQLLETLAQSVRDRRNVQQKRQTV